MINTEDEQVNRDNMELLVDQIAEKLAEMNKGQRPQKSVIRRFLEELKSQ